jgi:hypothetical protein
MSLVISGRINDSEQPSILKPITAVSICAFSTRTSPQSGVDTWIKWPVDYTDGDGLSITTNLRTTPSLKIFDKITQGTVGAIAYPNTGNCLFDKTQDLIPVFNNGVDFVLEPTDI